MNLPEILQQHFNYPELQKIDPNTEELTEEGHDKKKEFGQAAIPAILTGMYKLSRTDEGAALIVRGDNSTNWVKDIFGGNYAKVVQRVAAYAGDQEKEAERKMNIIATKAAELVREATAPDYDLLNVKEVMSAQRIHLLPYLPAVLQIGELLNDSTLDDNTNKMQGPLSNLVRAVGGGFNQPDPDEKTGHS